MEFSNLLKVAALVLVAPCAVAQQAFPVPTPVAQILSGPALDCLTPPLPTGEGERQWLDALYAPGGYQPLWNRSSLQALVGQLDALADDGLEPQVYHLDALRHLAAQPESAERAQACQDVLASTAYLQALHDLNGGRLAQARVEPLWQPDDMPPAADFNAMLGMALAEVARPERAFEQARPSLARYRDLRQRYAALRREPLPQWLAIPDGPLLRPGAVDERVALLEQRLQVQGDLSQGVLAPTPLPSTVYGTALVEAVKLFQRNHLLKPDGVVGPGTLAELNRTADERMDQIRINLERLRWLAHEIQPTSVLIDIAGAEVFFLRDNRVAWQARTQVGRPSRATPLLRSHITHLTLNPTWTIPPTILREDKLPELSRDAAGYLAANRMRVIDYEGNEVDPHSVDWQRPGRVLVRQDAGPGSALGRVVVRFPNPFSVYLHDTPSQRLFDNLPRLFSSGCVRIERVSELVDQLLAEASPSERERVAELWNSGETKRVNLPRPIPIVMAYWTVQMGGDGQLQFRPDIYGHDARLLKALNQANRI
ncbi:L,D-transpeptidase family protein [Pseudomonas sp. DTU_2021_1001937_2_SI_NGA_ILE_001]|uniref:L,D-transpeptidase family protein n=1 Tax=Pseudomonas sp. DTU_2021_1001937_2_SI_NGA_ILE_001 TaxID=3077589 RepID=UPI0028FC1472|nr:L,D-transpeptidase family protein [Pseudomonas sp. DTU_2021_1001937_2_SI_NGA_ILE_001]WNW14079.1 L,D-transpeptidase family protein [Pseudomonas sp. DTU_2021_1001937_2_SI_NGA_ILE_001]